MSKNYIFFIALFICICLTAVYTIIFSKNNDGVHESFSNEQETFLHALIQSNLKIINITPYIKYKNRLLTGHIGQNIKYNIYSPYTKKKYIILRYPDFRNEHLRHSKQNLMKFLEYIKQNIKQNQNYILDYVGYHGIIDDKVRLWIKLNNSYGRNIAGTIMPKTYLIPNDEKVFWNDYKIGKKYILKNSFGGARSALNITKSKQYIIDHFNKNKYNGYNAYECQDASCHSKTKYNIIQEYITPTFLIMNRKFGLRLFLCIIDNKYYIYKNGLAYYSTDQYNNSTNINNNVVGSTFKTMDFIKKNNLPYTYIEFKEYALKNIKNGSKKIYKLEKKLVENFKKIIQSNKKDLFVFNSFDNVQAFSIFAFDIEFDKDFNPLIFEGNFYFSRFNTNNLYGRLTSDMYNDIYHVLGITPNKKHGFIHII
jgi:hypothetical protein